MDIEQLKLILETLGAAGEGTSELAFWWIARGYFSAALTSAGWFAILYLAWRIARLIAASDANASFVSFGKAVEEQSGLSLRNRESKSRILTLLRHHDWTEK